MLAPPMPSKFEPPAIMELSEPELFDEGVMEGVPHIDDPMWQYLPPDNVEKTHEMSIQCDPIEEEKQEFRP